MRFVSGVISTGQCIISTYSHQSYCIGGLWMQDCTVVWQWFDNTRWCSYSPDTCVSIENAYQNGETSTRCVG